MKYCRALRCCAFTKSLVPGMLLLLLLVSPSRATLPENVINIYKIDLSHTELFEKKQRTGCSKPIRRQHSFGILCGHDSYIQGITPVFQRQYLLTWPEPELGLSGRQLHRTQEPSVIEASGWSHRLIRLLSSHNSYCFYHLPLFYHDQFQPGVLSILNQDFERNPPNYELSTSIPEASDTDPLLDALIHIQSRLGNPSQVQTTSSFTTVVDQAQHYMHARSDYPNCMLNIDDRYQVYVLSGTPLSQSTEDNVNEGRIRSHNSIRLLGFIILRLNEDEAIDESFFMELAFDRGNPDNPNRTPNPELSFRQAVDIRDDFDESVTPSFASPSSGRRDLRTGDLEHEYDVQFFLNLQAENGRRSRRMSSLSSRDSASSTGSYGLRRTFSSLCNSFSRYAQSVPIDIPGSHVRNSLRSADYPDASLQLSDISSESGSQGAGEGAEGSESLSYESVFPMEGDVGVLMPEGAEPENPLHESAYPTVSDTGMGRRFRENIVYDERGEDGRQSPDQVNPVLNVTGQRNPGQLVAPNDDEQRINGQLTTIPAFFSIDRPRGC